MRTGAPRISEWEFDKHVPGILREALAEKMRQLESDQNNSGYRKVAQRSASKKDGRPRYEPQSGGEMKPRSSTRITDESPGTDAYSFGYFYDNKLAAMAMVIATVDIRMRTKQLLRSFVFHLCGPEGTAASERWLREMEQTLQCCSMTMHNGGGGRRGTTARDPASACPLPPTYAPPALDPLPLPMPCDEVAQQAPLGPILQYHND